MIAYLQLGNNDLGIYSQSYLVRDVVCKFERAHNSYRPVEDAFCRKILISVFITSKDEINLYNWYISGESQEGKITIQMSDPQNENEEDLTEIEFSDAFCFELKEEYEIDTQRRILTLGLISVETKLDEVVFKR